MGSRCSYAHGDRELRFTPEFYKTSLCTAFQKGLCNLGEKCRYAHGDVDIRTSSIFDNSNMMMKGGFGMGMNIGMGQNEGMFAEGVEFPIVNKIDEKKT